MILSLFLKASPGANILRIKMRLNLQSTLIVIIIVSDCATGLTSIERQ